VFAGLGYGSVPPDGSLTARLERDGRLPLLLRMVEQGRVFGGSFALEVTTVEPVLPETRGLRARGRGVVRLTGVEFRPRDGDAAGAELARRLVADPALGNSLRAVHFERIRVEPDGRPVVRQMGGSVVWMLFPPMVRPVPLVPEQAEATVRALEAFAAAGE
jgi:hypothetical protein